MSQNVPSQVPPTVGAESDLDDFDLNQVSINFSVKSSS